MSNKPADTIRDGAIKATIWKNTSDNGDFYSVDLSRGYKQGDDWKETTSLTGTDVLRGARLLERAYDRISQLRVQSSQTDPQPAADAAQDSSELAESFPV